MIADESDSYHLHDSNLQGVAIVGEMMVVGSMRSEPSESAAAA